ncbi:unnamed protein product [Caenorhabditis angaria]|uniref:Uncharacterized protein n=1 Tax=Caenorhabditis angaria TaxID=860376 RepID=A0A9P1I706_9PELO|nr:unnamed protein product [Caenorhabditis angaria]
MEEDKIQQWSVNKLLAGLERIVSKENVPSLSENQLERFRENGVLTNGEALDFFKFVHKKSGNQLQKFGTPKEMLDSLADMRFATRYYWYKNKNTFFTKEFLDATIVVPFGDEKSNRYIPKFELVPELYALSSRIFITNIEDMTNVSRMFIESFLISQANYLLKKHEDSYDFTSHEPWLAYVKYLRSPRQVSFDMKLPKIVKEEDFLKIRDNFYENTKHLFDEVFEKFKSMINVKPIKENQEFYHRSYRIAMASTMLSKQIEETFMVFRDDINSEVPLIRLFLSEDEIFVIPHEVKKALYVILRKMEIPQVDLSMLIPEETKDERKLGIVNTMTFDQFNTLLTFIKIGFQHFNVIRIEFRKSLYDNNLPVYSTFGTPIKPIKDSFADIIHFITVVLKVTNIPKIVEFIDGLEIFKKLKDYPKTVHDLVAGNNPFKTQKLSNCIETWKIDEVMDQARKHFATIQKRTYEVPQKSTYSRKELFEEVEKLGAPKMNEDPEIDKKILELIGTFSNIDYRRIYQVYYSRIRMEVEKRSMNMKKIQKNLTELAEKNSNFVGRKEDIDRANAQLLEILHLTLSHFSNNSFKPMSEFENVLKKHFRSSFDDDSWSCIPKIFKTREMLKPLEKFFDFKYENYAYYFKKKNVLEVDPVQQKLLQAIEEYEKVKSKSGKKLEDKSKKVDEMRKTIDVLQDALKNVENPDKTAKKYQEEIDNLKKQSKLRDEKIQKLSSENSGKSQSKKKCNNLDEVLEKYRRYSQINFKEIISNIKKLSEKNPNSIEILTAKLEVLKFEENFGSFSAKVSKQFEKLKKLPNVKFEELEEEDVDEFPSEEFMEKYNKWMQEYNI